MQAGNAVYSKSYNNNTLYSFSYSPANSISTSLFSTPVSPKHSSFQYLDSQIRVRMIFSTRYCGFVPCMLFASLTVLFAMTCYIQQHSCYYYYYYCRENQTRSCRPAETRRTAALQIARYSMKSALITRQNPSPPTLRSARSYEIGSCLGFSQWIKLPGVNGKIKLPIEVHQIGCRLLSTLP